MKSKTTKVGFLFCFLFPLWSSSQNLLVKSGENQTFKGTLKKVIEKDNVSKENRSNYYLLFDEPIDMVCHPEDVDCSKISGIKKTTLFRVNDSLHFDLFVNKEVEIMGSLFNSPTMHYHTVTMLEVNTIKLYKKSCVQCEWADLICELSGKSTDELITLQVDYLENYAAAFQRIAFEPGNKYRVLAFTYKDIVDEILIKFIDLSGNTQDMGQVNSNILELKNISPEQPMKGTLEVVGLKSGLAIGNIPFGIAIYKIID